MAAPPSVGDVMMLSQFAWKIGCAFTSGRPGAPAEFREVENELTSLTKAITLLSEVLDRDDSVLLRADEKIKDGLDKILECCRQTLENLGALVDQYQEVRQPEGTASLAVQRVWKPIFIRNYRRIWWTAEGGGIQSLKRLLEMHVNSIALTMQALQSKSLARVQSTIEPMADRVAAIHDKLGGDLDLKMAEIQNLMLSMTMISGVPGVLPSKLNHYSSTDARSPETRRRLTDASLAPPYVSARPDSDTYSYSANHSAAAELPGSEVPPNNPDGNTSNITDYFSRRAPGANINRSSPRVRSIDEAPPEYESAWRNNNSAFASEDSQIPEPSELSSPPLSRPPQLSLPIPSFETIELPASSPSTDTPSIDSSSLTSPRIAPPSVPYVPNELSQAVSQAGTSYAPSSISPLSPSSAGNLSPFVSPNLGIQPSPPSSFNAPPTPVITLAPDISTRAVASEAEHAAFEQELSRDSALLCEAHGTAVEYAVPDPDNPGEFKMTEAASFCHISIITKMQRYNTGSRFITSIWTLSDDRRIRLQQKLPDGAEVIPYTIWGNNLKVVLRIKADMKFHDVVPAARPHQIASTSWVNYIFSDETGSALFQSVLMGKSLILSLRTKRTLRVHEGLAGAFAFQEQLCGLENVRLWQDDAGDVLAMIHYSAQFRDGYLTFQVGLRSKKRIHFKDDGEKCVKIKGLRVELDSETASSNEPHENPEEAVYAPSPKPGKSKAEKKITAVKIEFLNNVDKKDFLNKLREIQGR